VCSSDLLLARVWVDLNARGLAVHPYYLVTDQVVRLRDGRLPSQMVAKIDGVRARLSNIIGLRQDEMLHMLLRVGLPKSGVPRSRRLPLSDVFFDHS
jgi:hypothetical protein